MRTLRDLMFEQTVLNFGQIFSKEKQNVQFKYENEILKGIYLAPELFDKILDKSRQMSWRISLEELLPCLENVDKLRWTDLSYFTDRVLLRPKDVSFICRKRPTMKSLSVQIICSDFREVSDCLSEVVGSLEKLDLSLTYKGKKKAEAKKGKGKKKAKAKKKSKGYSLPLFRLKHLSYNQNGLCLPLNIDPESLERFDFRRTVFVTGYPPSPLALFQIEHLTTYLEEITTVVVSNLAFREHLKIECKTEEGNYKAFVNSESCDENLHGYERLKKNLIEMKVSQSSVYEILSLPEMARFKYEVENVVEHLHQSLLSDSNSQQVDMGQMEELLIRSLDYEMSLDTFGTIKKILDNVDMGRFSTDFKIKLISRMCSLAPFLRRCMKLPVENLQLNAFLLDYIENNPHKQLARKITKTFELYPEVFEGKKQVVVMVEILQVSLYEFE